MVSFLMSTYILLPPSLPPSLPLPLSRLRQCCSHPQLLTTALDTGSEDADLAAAMDTLSIEESKISLVS